MPEILIVDDEMRVREMLSKALKMKGYEVTGVPSAEQAMDLVFQRPFDLILLDLRLSGESGLEVLKNVRGRQSSLPIVVYSGLVTEEVEKEARLAGANEVLSKTTEIPQLVSQLDRIVRARERIFQDESRKKEMKILIVDDEQGIREVLAKYFKAKGYRTVEAENGARALELAGRENCSVALLDIRMPGMDGLETLEKLRKIAPEMGVVMVTGEQDDGMVKRALELGAYGYVLKPFDFLYLDLVVTAKLVIAGERSS